MSTEDANTPDNSVPTFADRVNEVVAKATVDDSGNLQLPDGLEADENVLYAANLEKRRRDTQSAYSRGQTELAAARAENEKLAANLQDYTSKSMTQEQRDELEELKHSDPDAWRSKLNELEQSNKAAFEEKRANIAKEAKGETELSRREAVLEEFNTTNPDIQITDDLLANDIPPRITKQLEAGEVTFEEFLDNVKEYMTKGKVVAPGDKPPASPNMSEAGGGSKPTEDAVFASISESYKDEVF